MVRVSVTLPTPRTKLPIANYITIVPHSPVINTCFSCDRLDQLGTPNNIHLLSNKLPTGHEHDLCIDESLRFYSGAYWIKQREPESQ